MISNQELTVPCLENFGRLIKTCQQEALTLSKHTQIIFLANFFKNLRAHRFKSFIAKAAADGLISWKEDYEVEHILDHCTDDQGENFFLIKWKGWGSKFNSWEPEKNLQCGDLVHDYYRQRVNIRKRKIDATSTTLVHNTKQDQDFFLKIAESVENFDGLLEMIKLYTEQTKRSFRLRKRKAKKLSSSDIKQALENWEAEINAIAKGFDRARLFVENKVDLEGPPENFIYVNERIEGKGVVLPTDPLIGCECKDCYKDKKMCCPVSSDSMLAYYKSNGRLFVQPGVPIFECNKRCKCGPDCCNRVVQKGRRFRLCIFRTANCRGWGVKTLQRIKKGSFVLEYVGEVITNEEAEKRGKYYDAVGHTYLFDLDFHDSDAPFTVDAGKYGNAAHFINHSCDPNLSVHVVWINTLDPQLPHICLFAKRDIQIDEELTFDYLSGKVAGALHEDITPQPVPTEIELTSSDADVTPPSKDFMLISPNTPPPSNAEDTPPPTDTDSNASTSETFERTSKLSMSCLCGSKNCRKILFF